MNSPEGQQHKSTVHLSPVLDIVRKALRVPARCLEHLEARRKYGQCCAADGVVLHPPSRIGNLQNIRESITIGKGSQIHGELLVLPHGGRIRIGEHSFVGEHSKIWSAASITIGNRVLISHNVNVHDSNSHSLSAAQRHGHFRTIVESGHPSTLDDVSASPVVLEDDVWVGFNATILKGVHIGRGAVIGAGSVVTTSVAPYTIVVGNPARIVGHARP